jgi:hypothetical protein
MHYEHHSLALFQQTLFCIRIYTFSMRSWLKKQPRTNRDQAQRQEVDSVTGRRRLTPLMQHRTAACTATEGTSDNFLDVAQAIEKNADAV